MDNTRVRCRIKHFAHAHVHAFVRVVLGVLSKREDLFDTTVADATVNAGRVDS